jgi:long-chain acyl-CoA synthetase
MFHTSPHTGIHTRIHQLFDERAAQAPDHPFLFMPDRVMTLGQLAVQVNALEAELRDAGVRLGDRVLVAAENCPEHVALVLACSRVGAWACGVNARMTASELAGFAAKADARVLYFTVGVSEAARQHAQQYDTRESVLPALRRTLADAQATAQTGDLAERVAAIIFTSGTTGQPKGVMLTHAGLLQFGKVSAQSRQLVPTDRSYAYLPMTHIFGLGTVLMASLHAGAGLLMRSQFDPADVFDALAHQGLTQLQGPPAMFTRLLAWLDSQGIDHPAAPDLRYVYTGAAPLDLSVKKAIEARFGQPLHHGYGLSEYAGALTLCRRGEWRDDTSAGYLVEGAELRIVDAQGHDLPAGETGEIWMRGVGLMPGYFRDPEITDQVMKPGGWYASGDLGRQDADGALQVVGRLKEMIIRSGFNVYPGEVEAVFLAWPGVQRAAVAGRKTADGNEDILAFIEPKPGAQIDLDALKAHAHEHLSPYKRPSVVALVPEMPMTLSGKVLKRELVEQWQSSQAQAAKA